MSRLSQAKLSPRLTNTFGLFKLSVGKESNSWDEYQMLENGMIATSISQKPGATKLEAGAYLCFAGQKGEMYFVPKAIETDSLMNLPDMTTNIVFEDIKRFWEEDAKQRFNDLGMVYKRGILLYGDPGTGKSAAIIKLAENVINDGGIVLFNPAAGNVNAAIQQIRSIEGENRKVLVIFEEVETMCDDSSFLSLLDGELQVDSVAYVATTNYIDKIPKRIKNRPSRFARVIEVGYPSYADRYAYITHKLQNLYDEKFYTDLSTKTEGMVLDQIKDVIISLYVFNVPVAKTIKKINEMKNDYKNEAEETQKSLKLTDDEEDFLYNKILSWYYV